MKKLSIITALLFSTFFYGQEGEKPRTKTLSVELAASLGGNIGLSYEDSPKQNKYFKGLTTTKVARIYYIGDNLESDSAFIDDIPGNGIGISLGQRNYFNETAKGFYFGGNFGTESIKYKESKYNFEGTYTYITLFSPEIGYKFLIAKKIAVNFHAGTSWLIEYKGKGDIDNKDFDNWIFRAGLSVGYAF